MSFLGHPTVWDKNSDNFRIIDRILKTLILGIANPYTTLSCIKGMRIVPLKERSVGGRFTIVDDADFEWVSRRPWPYRLRTNGRAASKWVAGYAGNCGDTLHSAIMRRVGLIPPGMVVIHQNNWGLDNRRENLILARAGWRKNRRNIHRTKKGWRVQVGFEIIGRYPTEEEALAAHEIAARAAGYITPAMQMELRVPVIEQLEAWVAEGRLIRHIPDAPLIEDRYRLRI